jgi:hypothetical protein
LQLFFPTHVFPVKCPYTGIPVNDLTGDGEMDEALRNQLDWMNANLNTIALNQAILYSKLTEIEQQMTRPGGETD